MESEMIANGWERWTLYSNKTRASYPPRSEAELRGKLNYCAWYQTKPQGHRAVAFQLIYVTFVSRHITRVRCKTKY
jgi:hypothetical protein